MPPPSEIYFALRQVCLIMAVECSFFLKKNFFLFILQAGGNPTIAAQIIERVAGDTARAKAAAIRPTTTSVHIKNNFFSVVFA